jgi:hypothetical protein
MRWPKWSIVTGQRGDFLPIMIGCILLFISVPAFVLLLVMPDHNSEAIGDPLLVWFAIGTAIGAAFVIHGLRVCASPGSRLYRIAHGRFFSW